MTSPLRSFRSALALLVILGGVGFANAAPLTKFTAKGAFFGSPSSEGGEPFITPFLGPDEGQLKTVVKDGAVVFVLSEQEESAKISFSGDGSWTGSGTSFENRYSARGTYTVSERQVVIKGTASYRAEGQRVTAKFTLTLTSREGGEALSHRLVIKVFGETYVKTVRSASGAEIFATRPSESSLIDGWIGGTGSFGGATFTSGGTISPGSSPGAITTAGALILESGSHYEIGSLGAGTLTVSGSGSGAINFSGGTLSLGLVKTGSGTAQLGSEVAVPVLSGTLQGSDTILVINGSSSSFTGGTFVTAAPSGLASGSLVLNTPGSAYPVFTGHTDTVNLLVGTPRRVILSGTSLLQTGLLLGGPGAVLDPSLVISYPPHEETSPGDSGSLPSP